jgi:hypothetical protein
VKTVEGLVWKIQFVDFEGSSTGTTVFQKTDLGIISAISDPNSQFVTFDAYPNPASEQVNILFTVKEPVSNKARIQLLDLQGRVVSEVERHVVQGLNAVTLPVASVSSGLYIVRLSLGNDVLATKIQITESQGE